MNISELIEESHQTAISKGWWGEDGKEDRNFPEQLALMHSELSEVLEEYRNYGLTKLIYEVEDRQGNFKSEGVAVEFADLLIRVFDTCGRYNIPLEDALRLKMAYNKTRPHKHGGKLC